MNWPMRRTKKCRCGYVNVLWHTEEVASVPQTFQCGGSTAFGRCQEKLTLQAYKPRPTKTPDSQPEEASPNREGQPSSPDTMNEGAD